MKAITTLLFFAFYFSTLHAQESRKHQVYFASDKHEISASELTKLKFFLRSLEALDVESIQLTGHTDSDADEEYNIELSDRRVKSVQEVIATFDLSTIPVDSKFYGESKPVDENTHPEGKQNNRRVEIVLNLKVPEVFHEPQAKIPVQNCSYDTTLIFPQGTEVTMNICDYFAIKDCFQFIEYNTGESIRNSNLTTMTADGTPLISGGMFEIKMCKEVNVSVYIPRVPNPCDSAADFTLWTSGNAGTWSPIKGTIDRVRRGGREFLKTVVSKTTSINLDALPPITSPPPKMFVKVPTGFKIRNVKLSTDVPASLILAQKVTNRKATFLSICPCSEPLIYLEVENRKGELDTLNYTQLNDYDKREAFGKCKMEEVTKRVLFLKIRKKSMYRKYLIRKSDFSSKT